MLKFIKYHGLGNDYLVFPDAEAHGISLSNLAIAVCTPHTGFGADGILTGPGWLNGEPTVRIFNPDGSEAEKSGNGLRIFARYLVEYGHVAGPDFAIHCLAGRIAASLISRDEWLFRMDMGKARFDREDIPMTGGPGSALHETLEIDGTSWPVTCLSMGNPHCVFKVDETSEALARRLGPLIERHARFPNRTNVQFVQVLDRHRIAVHIWERGAGYTLASGSSSCAAARAAYAWGDVDANVTVLMPGGSLHIDIQPDESIFMTGPVAKVGEGSLSDEFVSAHFS